MDTSVMDLPAPVAARLRRPGWRDPRLLAGVAMVAASVLLGSWAVRTAQATVPVYVTRAALVPGDRVTAADLAVVDVRLGTVNLDHYLRADLPVAFRGRGPCRRSRRAGARVGRGLVRRPRPATRLGDADARTLERRGARRARGPVVHPSRPEDDAEPTEPSELAGGLTVAEVSTPSGPSARRAARGPGAGPQLAAPRILTALAAEGTVDVVRSWARGADVAVGVLAPSRAPRRRSSSRPSSRRADG